MKPYYVCLECSNVQWDDGSYVPNGFHKLFVELGHHRLDHGFREKCIGQFKPIFFADDLLKFIEEVRSRIPTPITSTTLKEAFESGFHSGVGTTLEELSNALKGEPNV